MNAAVLGWWSRLLFFVSSITLGAVVVSAADQDVTVRTSLDRTAMFVGDRAAYTIEITCKRGVDVLADDVSRDKLKLGGLEVVGGDTSRRTAPDDSTVYTLRYVLTTYRVDAPALTIGPLSVRYAVTRRSRSGARCPTNRICPAFDRTSSPTRGRCVSPCCNRSGSG